MNKNPLSEAEIAKILAHFRQIEDEKKRFVDAHGHARPPMSWNLDGKRLIVIGGSIYKQTREGPYTFLHAVHDTGLDFFGVPYMEVEEAKPFEQRHPAIQWMHAYVELSQRIDWENVGDTSVTQIGGAAAWFRFAYDIYTIRDNAQLTAALKKRLLSGKDFQGARHELWVAALCVAAGFTLTFEDETDNSRGHAEFIATDLFSTAIIAVEAKSRHRRGIKGFSGGLQRDPGEKVDVRGLVLEAFTKPSDFPLYVFVDVNLPPAKDEETLHRWLNEIDTTMNDLATEGMADPCPANAIFFQNDPSHYLINERIGNESDRIWIKHYEASVPRISHPPGGITKRLLRAHDQRLVPPADFPEQQ